jgi:hypothetical protein
MRLLGRSSPPASRSTATSAQGCWSLVVEVKAVSRLLPVHEAQVTTYLRLLRPPIGLLVNLHVPVLREGLRRLVNPTLDFSGPPFFTVQPSAPTFARSGQ